jgi:adenylylsulfate kinase-like enzyme
MKPALQFFELVLDKPEDIFKEYIFGEENRRKGMKQITHFFKSNNNLKSIDLTSNIFTYNEEHDMFSILTKKNKKIEIPIKINKKKDKKNIEIKPTKSLNITPFN